MVKRSLSRDVDLMTTYSLSNNLSLALATSLGIYTSRFSESAQNVAIHQCYTIGEDFDDTTYGCPYLKRI